MKIHELALVLVLTLLLWRREKEESSCPLPALWCRRGLSPQEVSGTKPFPTSLPSDVDHLLLGFLDLRTT